MHAGVADVSYLRRGCTKSYTIFTDCNSLSEGPFSNQERVRLTFVHKAWRYRWWVLLAVLSGLAYGPVVRLWRAKALLTVLATPSERSPRIEVTEEQEQLVGTDGPIRARLYRPTTNSLHRGIVLAHGIHYRGIEERRLVAFARALARSGFTVLTPELVDLADYRLTRASVDRIAIAVDSLASRRDTVEGGRVGLLGFSFAGGLSLVAASEPRLAHRLDYVVSVGGHHDLERVFHFLLTNEMATPRGMVSAKAHDYGLAVVLYANLEEFLPSAEVPPAREAFRAWLHEDPTTARAKASSLKGEGARLFRLLETQQLTQLSNELEGVVNKHRAELGDLSPRGHLKQIGVPVLFLHGSHDSVIPPSEAEFAGIELSGRPHDVLVTPLMEHVEVSKAAGLREKLQLMSFMSQLF
jgi:pimeloyl-ACP methyl ester carboxylesterase